MTERHLKMVDQTILTKNKQLRISEAIFACGGSSSLAEGLRLCCRQDCRRDANADACFSMEPVSLQTYKEIHAVKSAKFY